MGTVKGDFDYGSYGFIALRDLENAKKQCSLNIPDLAVLCAQQAVEKILKQYIITCKRSKASADILHSHSVRRITNCASINALEPYMAQLYHLFDTYISTRYPNEDFYEPTMSQAKSFVTTAAEVVNIVLDCIKNFKTSNSEVTKMRFD